MAGKVGRNCYRLEAEEQTNQTKVLLDLRTPWDSVNPSAEGKARAPDILRSKSVENIEILVILLGNLLFSCPICEGQCMQGQKPEMLLAQATRSGLTGTVIPTASWSQAAYICTYVIYSHLLLLPDLSVATATCEWGPCTGLASPLVPAWLFCILLDRQRAHFS